MPRKNPGEPYYRLDCDEAAKMYTTNDDIVIVDVRQPDEYAAGHIKGAMSIPVDNILAQIEELPTDKNLLFICEVGVRSGLACEMAAAMGINSEHLYNIESGTQTWIEAGNPTSYGDEE